jgi:hypothetical protein
MTLTMRQLGAEAAAKAKDVKKKTTTATSNPAPPTSATPVAEVPTSTTAKEREASDPSQEPDVTAAKTPAQLAAEGAKRTSVDKIDSQAGAASTTPTSARATALEVNEDVSEPAEPSTSKSTEEQVLDLRRQSTQVDVPSKLSESISADADGQEDTEETPSKLTAEADAAKKQTAADDVEPPVAEAVPAKDSPAVVETASKTYNTEKDLPDSKTEDAVVASPEAATSATTGAIPFNQPFSESTKPIIPVVSDDSRPVESAEPRSHRGSSVEAAEKSEIKKIEEQTKIEEHPEEDETAVAETSGLSTAKATESATAASEQTAETAKPLETAADIPQETAAKDPTAATKSVED